MRVCIRKMLSRVVGETYPVPGMPQVEVRFVHGRSVGTTLETLKRETLPAGRDVLVR